MRVHRKGGILALATILLCTVGFRFYQGKLDERPRYAIELSRLPLALGQWEGREDAGLDIRSQEILRLSNYLRRTYRNSTGDSVSLYLGYWEKQTGEYQAAKHSPELCLPSNGWLIERQGAKELILDRDRPQSSVLVKRIVGEHGHRPYLFYYWFFTGEKNYAEEWQSLLNISLQNFFAGRSDGGIVEVSTPLPGGMSKEEAENHASRLLESFLQELYPRLRRQIENPTITAQAKR